MSAISDQPFETLKALSKTAQMVRAEPMGSAHSAPASSEGMKESDRNFLSKIGVI
jgi:hypothetical protein